MTALEASDHAPDSAPDPMSGPVPDPVPDPLTGASGDTVVLLDQMGRPVGTMGKAAAHQSPGHWHAAFSAMLVDDDGRMLLQRRAAGKYHFPGRWTNSCCSHPRPGESITAAVRRRVPEELGIDVADLDLRLAGSFWYRAQDADTGLVEQEYDHVVEVRGVDPSAVTPNPDEVDEVEWVTPMAAHERGAADPESVTPWLHHVLDMLTRRAAEDA